MKMINKHLSTRKGKAVYFSIILILAVAAFGTAFYFEYQKRQSEVIEEKLMLARDQDLPDFLEQDLVEFNGVEEGKPIYLALEGYVYDVSEGSRFYAEGGGYHYLAGRDSTEDLKIAGGDIIKAKYPIIGRLVQSK